MTTHLISFILQALVFSAYIVFIIILDDDKMINPDMYHKVACALTLFQIASLFTTACVFITMIAMFLKHNSK